MDLGIIFESSSNNSQSALAMQKNIAKKILEKYNVSPTGVLAGAILFGADAKVEWKIGQAIDLSSVNEKIDKLKLAKGGSNLARALQMARDELLPVSKGARRNVPKTLLVFITEAIGRVKSLDDVSNQLKNDGVNVIVLVVGSKVKKQDLAGIASDPSKTIALKDPIKDLSDVVPAVALKSIPGILSNLCNPLYLHSIFIYFLNDPQFTLLRSSTKS